MEFCMISEQEMLVRLVNQSRLIDLVALTGKFQAHSNRHVTSIMPSTATRETSSRVFGWLLD